MADVFRWLAEAAGGRRRDPLHCTWRRTSNNAAEYEALIHGLNIAISLGIKRLMVYGDSLVVISQINKEWDCSSDSMGKYCTAVWKPEAKFEGLEFHHVERDRNAAADALSKLGSSRTQVPPGVFVQEVPRPSISPDQAEECNVLGQPGSDSNDWRAHQIYKK
jgi:ribonuclease HI